MLRNPGMIFRTLEGFSNTHLEICACVLFYSSLFLSEEVLRLTRGHPRILCTIDDKFD
jgi:hypothetical protein